MSVSRMVLASTRWSADSFLSDRFGAHRSKGDSARSPQDGPQCQLKLIVFAQSLLKYLLIISDCEHISRLISRYTSGLHQGAAKSFSVLEYGEISSFFRNVGDKSLCSG
jgi:hypothetical protein